ncbi:glycosyltransferase [Nocardioides nematodiphilus]|uniref:glycosyltransferase n=1 Tax=Nocardioides nematodiphilus TaxID=2849669 RepID=UPI001CDA12AA|nr:glycosyltransferase [Nocardioides nematodiphilus]MCA1983049.1 glycosyltransferase [Nocardioides nematodiphilus]
MIVLSAANSWDDRRMADAQLALALSRHADVLYVDPPRSLHRARLGWVRPGLARLSPEGLPGISRAPVAAANRRLIARQVTRALRRFESSATALVEANLLSPVLGLADLGRTVYWAQDDFVAMAPLVGVDPRIFAANHERLIREASLIVAANPAVAASITAATGRDVQLIPFGCDAALFNRTAPAAATGTAGGLAVLMGTLNERLDLGLLTAVADSGARLRIIGPCSPRGAPPGLAGLVSRASVEWLGERAFADLPRLLAGASVGLVPYTHSAFNEASFPLKTLEYLAAGLPVVATDLPAVRWLAAPDVHVADDAALFAKTVRTLLDVTPAEAEQTRERARATAQQHTWAERAKRFADLLG